MEGLTIEELRGFLTQQFKAYVRDPQVYVRPVAYRPIRIYVGGEVKRPGYYTLSGNPEHRRRHIICRSTPTRRRIRNNQLSVPPRTSARSVSAAAAVQCKHLRGRVPNSLRRHSHRPGHYPLHRPGPGASDPQTGPGPGRWPHPHQPQLPLPDHRGQRIPEHPPVRRRRGERGSQHCGAAGAAAQGWADQPQPPVHQRVRERPSRQPGGVVVPQGANLTQAIDMAGGLKLLHGRVEFVRFTREGEIDRRVFNYNPGAANDDYRNPVLMSGDVIRVRESPLSATVTVLNEVTAPAVGIYSVYSLFNGFAQ